MECVEEGQSCSSRLTWCLYFGRPGDYVSVDMSPLTLLSVTFSFGMLALSHSHTQRLFHCITFVSGKVNFDCKLLAAFQAAPDAGDITCHRTCFQAAPSVITQMQPSAMTPTVLACTVLLRTALSDKSTLQSAACPFLLLQLMFMQLTTTTTSQVGCQDRLLLTSPPMVGGLNFTQTLPCPLPGPPPLPATSQVPGVSPPVTHLRTRAYHLCCSLSSGSGCALMLNAPPLSGS